MVRCIACGYRNPKWPRVDMSHRLPVVLVRGEEKAKTVLYTDTPLHRLPVVAVRGKEEAEAAAAAAKVASTPGFLRGVQRFGSSAAWRTPPEARL